MYALHRPYPFFMRKKQLYVFPTIRTDFTGHDESEREARPESVSGKAVKGG